MRKKRNQSNRADQFDRDCPVIPGSGGVDSEEGEIPPIRIDRGGRHIGDVVAAAMRAVRQQEPEDTSFHPVCASLRQVSSKYRDGEDVAVVKHPLSGGDHPRDLESGSTKLKKAKTASLDSSHEAESSGGDKSSSNLKSTACERHVGNDFRAPKFARDRDRDSDRTAALSDARSIPADSCNLSSSTDAVRLAVRSKVPLAFVALNN